LRTKALHPALQQLSTRTQVPTNDDSRFYAFLKTAADHSERMLVVLNFQKEPQNVKVDMSGTLLELEKGRTEPRLNTIAALAGSFDKSISELFKGL